MCSGNPRYFAAAGDDERAVILTGFHVLARSTRNLLETMESIREARAKFQSLSEPWADTTTHAGKMIMTIFAGIAEFERELMRERTSAGRAAAQKRGVRFGRPRKLSIDQEQLARRLVWKAKQFPTSPEPLTFTLQRFADSLMAVK